MRNQIKKICGSTGGTHDEDFAPPLKEEVLYGYEKKRFGNGRSRGGRGRGRDRFAVKEDKKTQREDLRPQERKRTEEAGNPLNSYGIKGRCYVCDSLKHFANECPHKAPIEKDTQ